MDDRRFDSFARALAGAATRRALLAALPAALAAPAAAGARKKKKRCTGGRQRCDGACVDTVSNPRHCGACGAACAEVERCRDGACVHFCTLNAGNTVPCGGSTTATAFCCSPEKGCCGDRCCP